MKPTRTWILLADAASAKLLENTGPGKGIHEVPDIHLKAPAPLEPSDQQGRSFNSASAARHKLEPHQGKNETAKAFVGEIVSLLTVNHTNKAFDRLIICAAPETLGLIRQQLPNTLKPHVTSEIPKDLMKIPLIELPAFFEDVLAV